MSTAANLVTEALDDADVSSDLKSLLKAQRKRFAVDPMPTLQTRVKRLNLLHNALLTHRDAIAEAISADFSNRASAETEIAEMLPLLEGIAYYRKRLKRLMKPQRRHTPSALRPARVELHYQPMGVVGIVVPWNFPVFLALSPLIGALAAGNLAMIKMSEFTPATGALLKQIIGQCFGADEVCVVNGDVSVAEAFTRLPFDHLVFTGSTQVGRIVMRAAAENLTPVTLELGGKSPAIIHDSFPIEEAARRLAFAKGINVGQICIAPDYVFCPEDRVETFCDAFATSFKQAYPTLRENTDYTAIITDRQKARLQRVLSDAEEKGAQLITINPGNENLDDTRKLPMTLVLNPTPDMLVLREEIFGPVLPVLAYRDLDEALAYVNDRDRPLALYYFDYDAARADDVLRRTHSGGACINDSLTQATADDIPFGGVGPSGMGHYHGEEGFRSFSHAKGVVRKGRINTTMLAGPPWDNRVFKALQWVMKRKFRPVKIQSE